MKLRLLFSLIFGALLSSGFSQSIGLIGSATPNGWTGPDTNLVQNVDSAHLWSLEIHLTAGAVKFRQDDDWPINWGAADFPSGIGTQDGDDIPIPAAGDFTITFNSQTGAYNFAFASAIGITFYPVVWGFVAAAAEVVGGICVAVGFLFRPACILITATLIGALTYKLQDASTFGYWIEYAEMATAFFAMFLMGPGRFSLSVSMNK